MGRRGVGGNRTGVAIDAQTRPIPSWLAGPRDGDHARVFVDDRAGWLRGRAQITTGGLSACVEAIGLAVGGRADYPVVHKAYGAPRGTEARYSPGDIVGYESRRVTGRPDPDRVNTSDAERRNLMMRRRNRRCTGSMTSSSGSWATRTPGPAAPLRVQLRHRYASPRTPPAVRASVTDQVGSVDELVARLADGGVAGKGERRQT